MYRKQKITAIIAIAVAMVFVMPVAAFANVGTIGVTSNIENTSDIENMVESTDTISTIDTEQLVTESKEELCDGDEQPGWPIYTGYPGMTAPVFADFDPDYPGLETIVLIPIIFIQLNPITYSSKIYVWHQDGTCMTNWDPKILDKPVSPHSPCAAGDINRDGRLDLVIVTNTDDDGEPPMVHVFNYNGTEISGWPQAVGGDITSAPVLDDLDNDGYLEVLVSSKDGNLYIWRYDGSNFNAAWPKQTDDILYRSPSVGNLDTDADLEIVVGGGGSIAQAPFHVFVWNIDGTTLNENWPKTLDDGYRGETPALGDIDGDGDLEIVIGIGYHVDAGKVYAWNTDGSLVSDNWPKLISGYAFYCSLSDLDPEYPGLEIVTSIRYDTKIYAWHWDGSDVAGWPYTIGGEGGHLPAIGDIDGDGSLEAVTGSRDGKVYAINSDGSNQPGWPIQIGGIQVSGAIGDIDYDGKTEVVQPSTDGYVYMLEIDGTGIMTWPMLQCDERHTGCYIIINPPEPPQWPEGPTEGIVGVEYTFSTSTTDPEGEQIYYKWDWDDSTSSEWQGPYDSGDTVSSHHAWNEAGDYNITVKAKNIHNAESDWSDPKTIYIVDMPILEIDNITGSLFKVSTVIRNTGGVDATMVNWRITLDGGLIFLGKETTGSIASIPVGDESTVSSTPILGIGKTVVTVTVECAGSSDTKEQNAFVFLFFIRIINV